MHPEGDRVRTWSAGWPVEADRENRLDEVGLEEAALVFDRPTLVQQRRESKLRRVDVESHSHPHCESVSHAVDYTWMNGETDLARRVLDPGYEFKIERHGTFALERN